MTEKTLAANDAAEAPTTATPASSLPTPLRMDLRSPLLWVLAALITVIAVGAQVIGPLAIPVGIATLTILPMVWGLLAGGLASSQRILPMPLRLQSAANSIMAVAVLLLCGRLAFTIGPNVGLLVEAGPALLLQEVGHLFGTILLALPLAVLLRMGAATVGATFSIDREGAFAMVAERYGASSAQYRGVLSMYVFGTLFGAIIVSFIASVAASLHLFDPLALAMGAGVGSGSMMAAAAASVAEVHPEMADQVLAVAATSNLITGILGLYVGMYLSLPLADRFYRALTGRQLARATQVSTAGDDAPAAARPAPDLPAALPAPAPQVDVPLRASVPILVCVGIAIASVAAGGFSWAIVAGFAIITALTVLGIGIAKATRGKVAAIISVITLGALVTVPGSPIAAPILSAVSSIDFLSLCAVVLTVAGLSLGKDLPMLRQIGWKIIPVGCVAIAASYLLSVVVAEFALGLWG